MAVLTGDDYAIRDELVKKLSDSLSPYSNTLPLANDFVSVACGIAIYEKGTDLSVADIEKRADDAMYKDKARIKGLN